VFVVTYRAVKALSCFWCSCLGSCAAIIMDGTEWPL